VALGLSVATANGLLNALCRGTSYVNSGGIWIQLHIADPGAAGTASIATETRRMQATMGTNAASGLISNTAAVTWSTIVGSQDASHYSMWDASTAGTFLGSGLINANSYIAGDTYNMAIGAVVLGFGLAA